MFCTADATGKKCQKESECDQDSPYCFRYRNNKSSSLVLVSFPSQNPLPLTQVPNPSLIGTEIRKRRSRPFLVTFLPC